MPAHFPAEVLEYTNNAIAQYQLPELDRTDIPLVTIDPETSLDLDQAVHITGNDDGYLVSYAIADVAGFVQPASVLDEQCWSRVQTMYIPSHRIPLHPAELSEDAASLLPDHVRGAYLWQFQLNESGEVTSTSLQRARVRSIAKLSYQQCQDWLDSKTALPAQQIWDTVQLLAEVGPKRQALELARGGRV